MRELVGLCHYRLGNYAAAAREIEAYVELSGAVDQNPVLMDCYRAQHRRKKVDEAWQVLAAVSPSAESVAEGRIVLAGALADQGRLDEALVALRRRAEGIRNPKEHHLRLWYALADLEDRAGNRGRSPRPVRPRAARRPGLRRRRGAPRRPRLSPVHARAQAPTTQAAA